MSPDFVIVEVVLYCGAVLCVYGCWLLYRPAAFIAAGILMIAWAILVIRGRRLDERGSRR